MPTSQLSAPTVTLVQLRRPPLLPGQGLLFPERAALLLRETDDCTLLVDGLENWRGRIHGTLAADLLRLFEDGQLGGTLLALDATQPAIALIQQLRSLPALPLTAQTALSLAGFETLFVELTGRCDERCLHCYADAGPEVAASLDRDSCMGIVDDAVALGFSHIQWTGGDPLTVEFLPELVAYASARGILRQEIFTNGLRLTEPMLSTLLPHQPSFALSFYSHQSSIHDAITRTQGSHAQTLAALHLLLAAGQSPRVAVVLMETNAKQGEQTSTWLRSLGVQAIGFAASREIGRGSHHPGDPPRTGDSHDHRGQQDTASGCRGTLCIAYDGTVLPCIFNRRDRLGQIAETRLVDIAAAPSATGAWPDEASRLQHLGQLQCPGCRLSAQALRLRHLLRG